LKIIFNSRILKHKHKTGVEVYAENVLSGLNELAEVTDLRPNSDNKYFQHLWEHFIFPFKCSRADIVFCPTSAPIIKPFGANLVSTIHDVAFMKYTDTVSKTFYDYYRTIFRWTIKNSESVITVSEFSKSEIEKYFPFAKGKVHTVYNGINSSYKPTESNAKDDYILFVGSLSRRKNVVRLIKAYLQIADQVNEKLILAGNFSDIFAFDKEEAGFLKEAFGHPKIEMVEDIDSNRLINLYQKAKVMTYPSIYEGFGLPPVEAMACGTPVLTSNVTSMPEVCGEAAIYIDPMDVKSIADGLLRVLQNSELRAELTEKGLRQSSRYTWENSVKGHMDVFQKTLVKL